MDRRNDRVKRPSLKQLTVPTSATPADERYYQPPPAEPREPTSQAATAAPAINEPAAKTSRIDRDILMTGAGCVLILFAGLLIVGVFAMRVISDKKTPAEPTVPAVAAAAASPTATDTPEPTRTPTPTETSPYTPLPTWTPMGQKQQVADYRGHDAEYTSDMRQMGDFMQQSVQDVDDLLTTPDVTNQNWQYKVLTQTDVWTQFFYQLQSVIPPDQFQDFDMNFTKSLSHFSSAADDINYALEFDEPDRLNQAKTEIATGTQLLNDSLKSLQSSN